ncbi:MAG: FAD-dependent oxidoreductase [Candidatus Aenigmarchaeota archaeon]|nr:FAD-dependent oxidoreductase [Candidatus Aenigmarchaeota archaeon]
MVDQLYDLIIVGGGVVGYAGAMYAGRMQLKTLVLGELLGGTIILTDVVENYPGFIRLTGQELADKLKEHALDYKEFVEIKEEKVAQVKMHGNCFDVFTDNGKKYQSKAVIFATGMKHRELNVPGEKEFAGKGVHTCMLCDGFFFKNKIIGVVGGSDSAAKEALLGTQWAKKIYIIYRGEKIRAEPINGRRIEEKIKEGKMEIINNTNIKEIKGNERVTHVIFDKPYKGGKEFKLDGLFVEIGADPQSELAKSLGVKTNEKGEIAIDREAKTNVPGVFAAGDVVDTRFKQAITGAGEVVLAVYSAYTYINTTEMVCPVSDEEIQEKVKK